jgi:hypothetical protein
MRKKIIIAASVVAIGAIAAFNVSMNSQNGNLSDLELANVEALTQVEFVINANGRVGIFNQNPSVALEIGSSNSYQQGKINGSFILTSDERLKENIRNLSDPLEKIKQLRGVTYNFKGKTVDQIDWADEKDKLTPVIPNAFLNRSMYGFLAEELQTVLPDLVYKDDSTGILAIDYIGIIPLLVSAIKEQQKQIDTLLSIVKDKAEVVSLPYSQEPVGVIDIPSAVEQAVLYQNAPNPFNERTEIRYYLPSQVRSAEICVFDIQGSLVKKLTAGMSGSVEIKGSDLRVGTYLYTLIVDGKQVDTKQMVLTK